MKVQSGAKQARERCAVNRPHQHRGLRAAIEVVQVFLEPTVTVTGQGRLPEGSGM
jgi:hypothetical protein